MGRNALKRLDRLKKYLILVILGTISGFVNGFLGTGGGIILLFAEMMFGRERDKRDSYAETLCVMLVLSAVSAGSYFLGGSVDIEDLPRFCIPAALGGILGAFLLDRLPVGVTGKLFAVLVTVAGAIMLFG